MEEQILKIIQSINKDFKEQFKKFKWAKISNDGRYYNSYEIFYFRIPINEVQTNKYSFLLTNPLNLFFTLEVDDFKIIDSYNLGYHISEKYPSEYQELLENLKSLKFDSTNSTSFEIL